MKPETEDIVVRPAGVEDAPLLAALHGLSFSGPGEQRWEPSSVAEILSMPGAQAMLATRKLRAGRKDGAGAEPVGFAIIRTVADEGEIISIGIIPRARRRGIGALLLDQIFACADASGAARLFLEVAEDNVSACALYQARGFIQVGRRENYYHRGRAKRVHARVLSREVIPGG